MKIKISPAVWLMGAAVMLSGRTRAGNIAVILSAVLIHELGHLAAAGMMKIPIKCIRIDIFGAYIETRPMSCSYAREAFLCLAGPLSNLISAVLLDSLLPYDTRLFTVASVTLAVINLLPIKGFDGGRAISCLLLIKLSPGTVSALIDVTSFFCIFMLWSASVYFIMRAGAYLSLFVFSAALFARMFLPVNNRG